MPQARTLPAGRTARPLSAAAAAGDEAQSVLPEWYRIAPQLSVESKLQCRSPTCVGSRDVDALESREGPKWVVSVNCPLEQGPILLPECSTFSTKEAKGS